MSFIHICVSRSAALNTNGKTLPLASAEVTASEVISTTFGAASQQSAAGRSMGASARAFGSSFSKKGRTSFTLPPSFHKPAIW